MKTTLFLALSLLGCSQQMNDTSNNNYSFTNTLFQFENHYVDSCFSLSQSGAVTIVGENDSSPLDHDYDTFSWEYSEESNLLFITQQLENSRQISTFILEIEEQFEQGLNGCWSVQLGITTDLVCHCGFTNNPDYM